MKKPNLKNHWFVYEKNKKITNWSCAESKSFKNDDHNDLVIVMI